ncbi:hypothetical protein MKW94_020556, partial [Papaver nudicaule]|nr:hypothetical protein [Papaver nudicaule]
MAMRGYGGIQERVIRPIVIDYENGQFKSAYKQILKLQSKFPTSSYIPALKALVVERLGRRDEALELCLEAKDKLPGDTLALLDDKMLNAIQVVCQRLGRMDIAIDCYDHACKRVPKSLDLSLGLFNCYLRESDFTKQQQTALKMYKYSGEEMYLLWTICSIQLK